MDKRKEFLTNDFEIKKNYLEKYFSAFLKNSTVPIIYKSLINSYIEQLAKSEYFYIRLKNEWNKCRSWTWYKACEFSS